MDHNETIRREFSRQAAGFGESGLTLSSQEYLAWMVNILPLQSGFRVLDVAAGTGHLSRAIAPRVRRVVAMDMTPEMLEKAKEEAARAHLDNIRFEEGDAAALPYEDASFDMVVSRLALHHFETPEVQLQEMVRVCRPDHAVGLIDMLSPADASIHASYNRLELVNTMEGSGLAVQRMDTRDIHVDFGRWIEMTETDPQTEAAIRHELKGELQGGAKTGMRPYRQDGTLKFTQTWCVAIGTRSSGRPINKK